MSDSVDNLIARKIECVRQANTPIPRFPEVLAETVKRIEKDARNYLSAVVEAMIMDTECRKFSDVLDGVSMPAMLAIVEIDGVDRAALVNLDLDLVYHIVDLRMGGSPGELPEFAARRPTMIDNTTCKPMVQLILDGLSAGLSAVMGTSEQASMRCTHFEHLPMLANIVQENADVLCVKVSLDIGEAARSGNFEIILPFSSIDGISAKLRKATSIAASAASDAWASHMLDVVLDSEIDLLPVVHASRYSVAEMSRLQVGDVLELAPNAHQNITLQIDMHGELQPLATARLGALKGGKALKLTSEPDQEFLAPMARLAADSAVA